MRLEYVGIWAIFTSLFMRLKYLFWYASERPVRTALFTCPNSWYLFFICLHGVRSYANPTRLPGSVFSFPLFQMELEHCVSHGAFPCPFLASLFKKTRQNPSIHLGSKPVKRIKWRLLAAEISHLSNRRHCILWKYSGLSTRLVLDLAVDSVYVSSQGMQHHGWRSSILTERPLAHRRWVICARMIALLPARRDLEINYHVRKSTGQGPFTVRHNKHVWVSHGTCDHFLRQCKMVSTKDTYRVGLQWPSG